MEDKQIDLNTMSIPELKALGFDQQIVIKQAEAQLEDYRRTYNVILSAIQSKQDEQGRADEAEKVEAEKAKRSHAKKPAKQ